jgi:hypothetical protein
VETDRFDGTSYRAANWLHVGRTQGRGKLDTRHERPLPVKDVYLSPLQRTTAGSSSHRSERHGACVADRKFVQGDGFTDCLPGRLSQNGPKQRSPKAKPQVAFRSKCILRQPAWINFTDSSKILG